MKRELGFRSAGVGLAAAFATVVACSAAPDAALAPGAARECIGAASAADAPSATFGWPRSYGRAVGVAPDECADGHLDAGLCYPACQAGYYGVGPVCWQSCPAGYADEGAVCARNAKVGSVNSATPVTKGSYGRGAGTIPTRCSGGREYDAGLCYAKTSSRTERDSA
jgi:hypothetical protein